MVDKAKTDFEVGGFCQLAATTVAKVSLTPVALLKVGWPNQFLILDIYDDEEKGKLLRLDPCCGWMRDLQKEEKYACEAHHAKYFEPLPGHIKDQPKGEAEEAEEGGALQGKRRYSGFATEEGGEDVLGVEYVGNGGKAGALFFRSAGKRPIVVRGVAADKIMRLMSKLGIL